MVRYKAAESTDGDRYFEIVLRDCVSIFKELYIHTHNAKYLRSITNILLHS